MPCMLRGEVVPPHVLQAAIFTPVSHWSCTQEVKRAAAYLLTFNTWNAAKRLSLN